MSKDSDKYTVKTYSQNDWTSGNDNTGTSSSWGSTTSDDPYASRGKALHIVTYFFETDSLNVVNFCATRLCT